MMHSRNHHDIQAYQTKSFATKMHSRIHLSIKLLDAFENSFVPTTYNFGLALKCINPEKYMALKRKNKFHKFEIKLILNSRSTPDHLAQHPHCFSLNPSGTSILHFSQEARHVHQPSHHGHGHTAGNAQHNTQS